MNSSCLRSHRISPPTNDPRGRSHHCLMMKRLKPQKTTVSRRRRPDREIGDFEVTISADHSCFFLGFFFGFTLL
jgi:hypothetical protein